MSSKRLLAGGAALVAVAVALIVLVGGDGPLEPEPEPASLAAAACPPRYEVLRSGSFTAAEIAPARRGQFTINRERVRIAAPVEWTMNPQDARAFSHTLFKFQWIDPLVFAYRERGDLGALRQATALVLDFARANPPDGEPVDPDVWDDKRTGDRGPYLAYVMRAAECEGLLAADERQLLLELMARHVEVLTDPDTYKPTNHGLFVDLGLTLLARQLDFIEGSEEWAELGRERFERTLTERTVPEEGLWLEHSAGYQLLVARTLTRFLEVPGNESPELRDLRRLMQDVVGWLREPDGMIPQFGDSDLKEVPAFGVQRARADRGVLELGASGLAVAKRDGGYLAVLASYHSDAHKHSDALTFDLFDAGRRLITDTGLYHKDKDENFRFAHSERAHSTLVVDGEPWPRDGSDTWGSGIVQTGKGQGLVAILGTNPHLEEQDVSHQRLFLYEPGRVLVIVDRLRAEQRHRYARFLQFAPGIEIRRREAGLALRAPGFNGFLSTNRVGGEQIQLDRGDRQELRGLTSPEFRRWVPRWTARLRSEGRDRDHVAALTVAGPPVEADLVAWTDELIRIDLVAADGEARGFKLTEQDGDFRISRVPPEGER